MVTILSCTSVGVLEILRTKEGRSKRSQLIELNRDSMI